MDGKAVPEEEIDLLLDLVGPEVGGPDRDTASVQSFESRIRWIRLMKKLLFNLFSDGGGGGVAQPRAPWGRPRPGLGCRG